MSLLKKYDVCVNRLKYQKEKAVAELQTQVQNFGYSVDLLKDFENVWNNTEFRLTLDIKHSFLKNIMTEFVWQRSVYFFISDIKIKTVATRFYKIDNISSQLVDSFFNIPGFKFTDQHSGVSIKNAEETTQNIDGIAEGSQQQIKKIVEKLAILLNDEYTTVGNDIFEKLKSFQDFKQ